MTNVLAPVLKQKFFTNNGAPAYGYKVFTYEAGTNTKLDTYQSSNGAANTNPIILDFRGEANIWIPPNVAYKFVYSPPNDTDPPTSPIWTIDNVTESQLITLYGGVDTGIADAYVLNFTANFTTYTDGIVIYWTPSNTNTGAAVTINVNGLGPVSLTMPDGSNPPAGIIPQDGYVQIIYRGTGFHLMFSSELLPERGSFTIRATNGFTTVPTGTANWTRNGSIVTMNIPLLTGIGSGLIVSLTGIPADLIGDVTFGQQRQFFPVINGGVDQMGSISIAGATTFNVSPFPAGPGFVGGDRGVGPGVITYYSPAL